MDEKKIKDLMISSLLVKIITLAQDETETYYQQLVSNAYAMLDGAKAHLQGESCGDEDFTSKFDITDDDNQGGDPV